MPEGTILHTEAHFDNSADNPNNPDPRRAVTFGEQTRDEMHVGYLNFALADQDLSLGAPTSMRLASGHYEVTFRADMLDNDNPELRAAGLAANAILETAIRDIAQTYNPELDITSAANLTWSALQGLLVVHPKMTLIAEMHTSPQEDIELTASKFCQLLADGFRSR